MRLPQTHSQKEWRVRVRVRVRARKVAPRRLTGLHLLAHVFTRPLFFSPLEVDGVCQLFLSVSNSVDVFKVSQ